MKQTQSRISDERLAEIIASDGWSGSLNDITLTARELTALRASHKRLVEALQNCMNNLNMTRLIMPADARTQTAELLAEYRAALAEARKLEGK
jgi:hypothetical protein